MQKVKIGNRIVTLDPTYRDHKRLNEKSGLASGEVLSGDKFTRFVIDAIWAAIKRGKVFKPFITKRRMIKQMKPWDIDRMREMLDWVYTGHEFTEEELTNKVEEARERIRIETERIRNQFLEKTADELVEIIEGKQESSSEAVKKNGE